MKKPYLNTEQRESIILKTTLGSILELNISLKKLFREIDNSLIKLLWRTIQK